MYCVCHVTSRFPEPRRNAHIPSCCSGGDSRDHIQRQHKQLVRHVTRDNGHHVTHVAEQSGECDFIGLKSGGDLSSGLTGQGSSVRALENSRKLRTSGVYLILPSRESEAGRRVGKEDLFGDLV